MPEAFENALIKEEAKGEPSPFACSKTRKSG